MRRLLRTVAAMTAVGACAATSLAQTTCPDGRPARPGLGIGLLHCIGGSCLINVPASPGLTSEFGTEPRLRNIDPAGPAGAIVHEGDVLVAAGGHLITTPDGGRAFTAIEAGRPLRLQLRRGSTVLDVDVVPRLGCRGPKLTVSADEANSTDDDASVIGLRGLPGGRSPVDFGLSVACDDCGWRATSAVEVVWYSREPLTVSSVENGGPSDRAGIRTGDVLTRFDGRDPTTPEGARYLGTLKPNRPVMVDVRRGARQLTVRVIPRAPVPTHKL